MVTGQVRLGLDDPGSGCNEKNPNRQLFRINEKYYFIDQLYIQLYSVQRENTPILTPCSLGDCSSTIAGCHVRGMRRRTDFRQSSVRRVFSWRAEYIFIYTIWRVLFGGIQNNLTNGIIFKYYCHVVSAISITISSHPKCYIMLYLLLSLT